jgi:hypothetical protein
MYWAKFFIYLVNEILVESEVGFILLFHPSKIGSLKGFSKGNFQDQLFVGIACTFYSTFFIISIRWRDRYCG